MFQWRSASGYDGDAGDGDTDDGPSGHNRGAADYRGARDYRGAGNYHLEHEHNNNARTRRAGFDSRHL